ncbi:MAG: hypothetical protein U0V87_16015 [Acidobacteriota bacterium]
MIDLELGVERAEIADGAHWIYYPEAIYPFYRVGFPQQRLPRHGTGRLFVAVGGVRARSVATAPEL